MITGTHPMPPDFLKRLSAQGTDDFCSSIGLGLEDLPPAPEGWAYDLGTAIALKIKGNVEPHTDDFTGSGYHDVSSHRSLFWLAKHTSYKPAYLFADTTHAGMKPNDWVVFDDAQTHAFMADGTWVGLAVQLKPAA